MSEITLDDVKRAAKNVYQYLQPTPLFDYPGLSEIVGTNVWLKHENHQPVGAFKIRGGLNLVAGLSDSEKAAGIYTASTGNHGQSIAYAARTAGIKATVAVPEEANIGKVAAMRNLGATVVHAGKDFDEARAWAKQQSEQHGGVFVGPTDTALIEGVATYTLEIMQQLPDVDCIIVPVGAGSGACGTAIVAKAINPNVEVIAVQSAQAPAMQLSWQHHHMESSSCTTIAEGMATRVPFQNTQDIMRKYLDDFVLVSDQEINQAVLYLLEHSHNMIEEAGAAALAAAIKYQARFKNKKVVLVVSGGNLSIKNLTKLLSQNHLSK
jgi:threonine dehydratase